MTKFDQHGFSEIVIQEVEKHPSLYNVIGKDYRVKALRDKKWQVVTDEVNAALGVQLSVTDVETKWKYLRDKMVRLLRERKTSGFKDPEVEVWPYYNDMLFIKDYCKHRGLGKETGGNLQTITGESQDDSSITIHFETRDSDVPVEEETAEVCFDSSPSISIEEIPETIENHEEVKRPKISIDREVNRPRLSLGKFSGRAPLRTAAGRAPLKTTALSHSKLNDDAALTGQRLTNSLRRLAPKRRAEAEIILLHAMTKMEFGTDDDFRILKSQIIN